MRLSTIFSRAAREIDKRGLAKETHQDGSGRLCVVGACNLVARGTANWNGLDYRKYIGFLGNRPAIKGYKTHGLVAWNDDPKRTKRDVVRFLERAAKAAKKEGL